MRYLLICLLLSMTACGSDAGTKGDKQAGTNNPVNTDATGLASAYRGTMIYEFTDTEGAIIDRYQTERVYLERETDVDGGSRWLDFIDGEPLHFDPANAAVPAQRPYFDEDESIDVTGGSWSVNGTTLAVTATGTYTEFPGSADEEVFLFKYVFSGEAAEGGRFPIVDQPIKGRSDDTDYDSFGGFAAVSGNDLRIELHPNTTTECDADQFRVAPFFISLTASANTQDEEFVDATAQRGIYRYNRDESESGGGSVDGRLVIDEFSETSVRGSIVVDDDTTYVAGTFELPVCNALIDELNLHFF